jgi:branched-chain amino acid transport system ATP-binding protein
MAEPLLRAQHVSKRFGGLTAVDDVSLELYAGEIHAVIGPNGAGKSTLLAVLAGDLSPTSGHVFLGDTNLTACSVETRTRLGIGRTYQRSAVVPGFTALGMAQLAASRRVRQPWNLLWPMDWLSDVVRNAQDAIARVGLSDRSDVTTDVLSHGERRRLEIASVLALAPRILLLDEPLAGLGPEEARDVTALIADLKRDCAIVLIEHDIDVVFSAADCITVLDNGRVIGSGSPERVRRNVAVQQAYLGSEDETHG